MGEWTFRSQTKMKVAAIIVLLAVAVYAKPPGPPKGGKGDGDMEQKAPDVVMSMVKLCMRLSEMADDDDKRSWDAVFGLYGQVCEGIKAALEEKIEEAEADDDKRSGPMPTGMPEFSGPKNGKKGPRRGSGDVDDDDKRSGPMPTGMPEFSGPKGKKGSGADDDDDKPSGPKPSEKPDSDKPKGKGKGPRREDADKRSMSADAPPTPEEQLLKLCFDLAEMGEAMAAKGGDKRSLEQALMGMEQVCLEAFVQAKSEE